MLEIERTFLAKFIPKEVLGCESKELIDIYFPKESTHPHIRLRKSGNKYEITKKHKVSDSDASQHHEETIHLTEEEFEVFCRIDGKKVRKMRYYYQVAGQTAEVDIFQDDLRGLVVVDFEFPSLDEMKKFAIPDFCLADITQEEFIAGGKLCGKEYKDIEKDLGRFHYQKITTS